MKPIEIAAAVVLVIVLILLVLVESGVFHVAATATSAPRFQALSSTGENWTIPVSSPHVVKFLLAGTGGIWMNFTVINGGVSVFLCNATTPIVPLSQPAHCSGSGGLTYDSGVFENYSDATPYAAELAFINFGPAAHSGSTVYLIWTSPLEVVQR